MSELSLLHGETFLKYHPSMIAAASLALSRHALGAECHVEVTWPESLIELTGYTCETLKECLVSLHGIWSQAVDSPQQAIRDKYRSSKYVEISFLIYMTLMLNLFSVSGIIKCQNSSPHHFTDTSRQL